VIKKKVGYRINETIEQRRKEDIDQKILKEHLSF
jgi:hypothetical protein